MVDTNPDDTNPDDLNPDPTNPDDLNPDPTDPDDLNPDPTDPDDTNPDQINADSNHTSARSVKRLPIGVADQSDLLFRITANLLPLAGSRQVWESMGVDHTAPTWNRLSPSN